MSVIKKPDLKIFAQDAKTGEIETFPDVLRGWGITLERTAGKPPLEWFNAIGKRVDEWLMYLTQRGLAEWDSSVDYPKDALVQHSSVFYVALKITKGEQPNTSQSAWKPLVDFLGVNNKLDKTAVVQSTGASTTSVMSQKSSTDAFQSKGDYADGKRFASTAVETRIVDSDGNGYIYVNNANKATGFISKGNAVWRFDGSGVLTEGTIPFSRITGVNADSNGIVRTGDATALVKEDVTQSIGASTTSVMSQKASTDAFQSKGDYADGKRFASTAVETRIVDSDGNGYIYVNNANKATGFISKGNAVWRFDGSGVLTEGTIPFSRITGVNADSNGIVRTGDATALVKEDVTQSIGASTTSVMSQKASTDAFQPKGSYQPAGNYALKSDLNNYQPKGDYAQAGSSYTKSESDARYEKSGTYKQWRKVGDFNGASAVVEITLSESILGKYVYVQRDGSGDTYTGFLVPPIPNLKIAVAVHAAAFWEFIVSTDGKKLKLNDSTYGSAKGVYVLD